VTLFYGVHHVKEWLLPNRVELTILGEKVVEKSVTFLHGAEPYPSFCFIFESWHKRE
jgi:hypothetical protein